MPLPLPPVMPMTGSNDEEGVSIAKCSMGYFLEKDGPWAKKRLRTIDLHLLLYIRHFGMMMKDY